MPTQMWRVILLPLSVSGPVEFCKFWKWALFDTIYETREVYTVYFNYDDTYLFHLADNGGSPSSIPAEEVFVTEERFLRSRGDKTGEGIRSHVDNNAGKYGLLAGVAGGIASAKTWLDDEDDEEENNGIVVNVTNGGSVDIADNSPSSFDPSTTTGQ